MRIETEEYSGMTTNTLKEAMVVVLNELEKKDKIIELMAKHMAGRNSITHATVEQIIEYFTNKAENVGE